MENDLAYQQCYVYFKLESLVTNFVDNDALRFSLF